MSSSLHTAEMAELQRRLEEAEDTIRAIRTGDVDALVVEQQGGHRVYTLETADKPYRLFVEEMQQGAATLSAEGSIVWCNRRLAELLKHPHEKLFGAPLREFISPTDQAIYDNLLWQGQTRSGRGEARLQRADGGRVEAYLTFNVLSADCGAAIGVLITDLTAQRHHEQLTAAHAALRQSEARNAAVVNTAIDGIITIDHTGLILEFNPAAERIFGYRRDEVLGRVMAELIIPPPLWESHRRGIAHYLATGEGPILNRILELAAVRADGTEFPVEVSITRINTDDPPLFTGYIRDISERKQAEREARESEQRLRFIMDSMPQKIFTAGPTGEVDYFNPIWMQFTGLSFAQIRDWGWRQFIHPDDVAENVRVWQHSIDTGEPFQFEHRFRRHDGEHRWHISRAVAFKDPEGKVLMWIGSNTEIHEQRQTEITLRQLAADLSDADRRKTEFLAMLAHELRNPLAPIRNALHVVRRTEGKGEVIQSASEIMERQIDHMVRLVDDLLDVSRISQGKIELRRERVELASVIRQALETSRPAIEGARHQLTVKLPPAPVYLDADPLRLAQAFGNLLNNACKYSEPAGRIVLSAEFQGNEVLVSVRDSGVGITPEMLPKIFDLFAQADRSLERSQGGLGIGLTLVARLIEMHGGSVSASSDGPGRGSEFVVRLPVVAASAKPAPPVNPVAQPPLKAFRILVVDDNRDAATTLAMLLKMSGNSTQTAFDGLEAVQLADSFRPEVVLLDIGLPQLNGYEVARRIRKQPWGPGMLLIALTGWGQEEDRRKSAEAGFNAHLVKPVNLDALSKLLVQLLALRAP